MKKNKIPLPAFRQTITFFATLLFLFAAHLQTKAQLNPPYWNNPPIGSGYPYLIPYFSDNSIATVTNTEWINCDAYTEYTTNLAPSDPHHLDHGSQMMVIAYDDVIAVSIGGGGTTYTYNSSFIFISTLYGFANAVTTSLPTGARHPDIVIGDDPSSPGTAWIVSIVYEYSGTIYLKQYSITNILNGAGPTVTGLGPTNGTQVSGGNTAQYPHIDMFHDPGTTISWVGTTNANTPILSKYCISWTEQNNGGTWDIYAITGDLSNTLPGLGASTLIHSAGTNASISDIACSINTASSVPTAFVVYYDGTDIAERDWDPSSNTLGSKNTLEPSVTITAPPRIEAMNNYDPANGSAVDWHVVGGVQGSPYKRMHGNQSFGSTIQSTDDYGLYANSGLDANDGYVPVVTAGCGRNSDRYVQYTNNQSINQTMNDYYFCGWQLYDNSSTYPGPLYDFQAMAIDPTTAQTRSRGYIQVNSTAIGSSTTNQPVLALGCSSNSGWDMIGAWYDGNSTIYCKNAYNYNIFKPTSVNNTSIVNHGTISPNPASDEIKVMGYQQVKYCVTDMTGKLLLNGKLDKNNNNIRISSLANGMYLLQLSDNVKTENIKFVKE